MRRFISHAYSIPISPIKCAFNNPSRVQVKIPKMMFTCVKPVPIYMMVPPSCRELIVEQGLRLWNIKAKLIRIVHSADRTEADENDLVDVDVPSDISNESEEDENGHGGNTPLGVSVPSTEKHAMASSSITSYPSNPHQSQRHQIGPWSHILVPCVTFMPCSLCILDLSYINHRHHHCHQILHTLFQLGTLVLPVAMPSVHSSLRPPSSTPFLSISGCTLCSGICPII